MKKVKQLRFAAARICVPLECRRLRERRMAGQLSVVDCDRKRQLEIIGCLQKELTEGRSVLNSELGGRCCSSWPNTSALCRTACLDALNSATLSTYSKTARIATFCRENQNEDDQVTVIVLFRFLKDET